jgi:hypothetical protein
MLWQSRLKKAPSMVIDTVSNISISAYVDFQLVRKQFVIMCAAMAFSIFLISLDETVISQPFQKLRTSFKLSMLSAGMARSICLHCAVSSFILGRSIATTARSECSSSQLLFLSWDSCSAPSVLASLFSSLDVPCQEVERVEWLTMF